MSADLMAELAELVRLEEKATPGPFFGEGFDQIAGNGNFYGGILMGADGEIVVAQCVMPHNIELISKTLNFLCTRHAELEANARDAMEIEMLRYELEATREKTDSALKILSGIHELLYPSLAEIDGGKNVFWLSNGEPPDVIQDLDDISTINSEVSVES